MKSYRSVFLICMFFLFFVLARVVFKKQRSPIEANPEVVVENSPSPIPKHFASASHLENAEQLPTKSDANKAAPIRDVVRSAQGQFLFEKIFDESYFKNRPVQEFLPSLQSRFVNETDAATEKEEIAKVGILKALAKDKSLQSVSASDRAALVRFYQAALVKFSTSKTYPMAQTQIIRNLKTWITSLDERSHREFTAKVDPRWLLLASRSEREIAEDLFAASK